MEYLKFDNKYYPMSMIIMVVIEDRENCSLRLEAEIVGENKKIILGDIGSNGMNDNSIQNLIKKFKHNL